MNNIEGRKSEVDTLQEEYGKQRVKFLSAFEAMEAIFQNPGKISFNKLSEAADNLVQSIDAVCKVVAVGSYIEETAGLYDSEHYRELLTELLKYLAQGKQLTNEEIEGNAETFLKERRDHHA